MDCKWWIDSTTYVLIALLLVEPNDWPISNLPSSWATSKLLLKRPPVKLVELPELIRFVAVEALFLCCCCNSCILFKAAIFVKEDDETDLLSWCWTDKELFLDDPGLLNWLGFGKGLLLLLIKQIDDDVRENWFDLRRFGGVDNLRPVKYAFRVHLYVIFPYIWWYYFSSIL